MWKLFAFVAVCALVGSTMAQPCAPTRYTAGQPRLPSLPTNQFKAVIQAMIINKNMTVEAVEYVDESRNAAALKIAQTGVRATILLNYKTNEVFTMVPDADLGEHISSPMACMVQNLTVNDITQLFGGTPGPSSKMPHMYSTLQILNFINGTEVYKGRAKVSGIPVDHWSSCMYWTQLYANFTVDYYFTVPGWQTPSGMSQIPVRAEIRGQTLYTNGTFHNFHHIYQYVNFENYVNDPETIFETPPGVYCEGRKRVKEPPQLANHFYYREEISNPVSSGFALLQEIDIWFDSSINIIRYDQRDPPKTVSRDFSLSHGPYTIIHDFTIGVQYVIANDLAICSIDPIPLSAKSFDAEYNSSSLHLTMRNSAQFFHLNQQTYIYAGQRLARGQKCDVYQSKLTNLADLGIVIYEIYFLTGADDITDQGKPNSKAAVIPMRLLAWKNGKLHTQYEIHDFDQSIIVDSMFDVTPCYPGKSSIDFEIFVHIPDTNLMPQMAPAVKFLLMTEATIANGITALRMQKTRVHWDQWNVYFQGTLLGAAPSIAKYEQTKGFIMGSGLGKSLGKVWSADDCAKQCENLQEWSCVQFDYCSSSQVCTLGRYPDVPMLAVNNSCTHFRSVLGDWFDSQPSLDEVWQSLKNQVFHRQLTFDVPLPDANGYVDTSIGSNGGSQDNTQKMTVTAYYITNEVVSSANRNPASNNVMTNFQVIPNEMGKGFNTAMRGISVDDCAFECTDELTYNCQSFHYCWDAGTCFLSSLHPDERPDMLRNSSACDTYFRDYTSNFEQFPGMTVVSDSNVIYQNVISASQCAKLCSYYSAFHCESFDFCTDISACYLGQMHYFDAPEANIKTTESCSHYSRNYIQDFFMKSHKQVKLRDNRVIQDVTPTQCAKLCVEEGSFTCGSFDYCGNYTECRLSDASTAGTGQVTLESTAYCDLYIRQYGQQPGQGPSSNQNLPQTSSNGSSGYSGGSMGGLAIAMIVVGLILGVGAIVLYTRFFNKARGGDGMTVAFSKQEDTATA